MPSEITAADIIARLELRPHPEGGYYREMFRDQRCDAQGRACSTAIYFLLARGDRAHWHRIDSVEIWHFYAGSALTLLGTALAGIPVSTTHTITGAIVGVGATQRLSAVRWGVAQRIVWAWILTIPMSALMAALAWWIIQRVVA